MRTKPLPKVCYTLDPVTEQSVMILYGEAGYRPCPGYSPAEVRRRNEAMGLSADDERMMMIGSMFGWHAPGVVAHFHGVESDSHW